VQHQQQLESGRGLLLIPLTTSSSNTNNTSAGNASSTRKGSFTPDQARNVERMHVALCLIYLEVLSCFSVFVFRVARIHENELRPLFFFRLYEIKVLLYFSVVLIVISQ